MVRRRSTVRFRKGAPRSQAKTELTVEPLVMKICRLVVTTGEGLRFGDAGAPHVTGLVWSVLITPMVPWVGTSGWVEGPLGMGCDRLAGGRRGACRAAADSARKSDHWLGRAAIPRWRP